MIAPAMFSAALDYAVRGWPVFPCSPNADPKFAKQPLVPKSSSPDAKDGGLYLATTDEKQIRAWWSRWPKALIGVPTGARVGGFVLDLDAKAFPADEMLGGVEAFCSGLSLVDEVTGEVLAPPMVRTQSGGLHLWYAWPQDGGVGNRAGLFKKVPGAPQSIAEFVDVRGEGGYVIVPPSTMSDGKTYAWQVPGEFVPAPARLLDVILRRGEFGRVLTAPSSVVPFSAPAPAGDAGEKAVRHYGLAALDRAVANISSASSGVRNQTANDEALSIGHLVGAGALSRHTAMAALCSAAFAWGIQADDKCVRPGGTIERAMDRGISEPRDLSEIRNKAEGRAARAGGASLRSPPPASADDYGSVVRLAPRGSAAPRVETVTAPERVVDDAPDHGEGALSEEGLAQGEIDRTGMNMSLVEQCAQLDHSDTDNRKRFIAHFGEDLAVLRMDGPRNADFVVWNGTHWDMGCGNDAVFARAQQLGDLIQLEAGYLRHTPKERLLLESDKPEDIKAAEEGLEKRQIARRKFGVSSKNKARMDAMIACSAPFLLRDPKLFNSERLAFATPTHTVRVTRELDVEGSTPDEPTYGAYVDAREEHVRGDWISRLVPVPYVAQATCPKWMAFVDRFLPKADVRRFVQLYSGLGLTGVPIQKFMFHYGEGANGKSVFLETLSRVFGPLGVNLPAESLVGDARGSGAQASPDLARLYGARFVRVLELPEGEDLKEALVKKLTGGEMIPVRNLFKGFFDFQPFFKAHMSGNGYPKIVGTDNGIWRRVMVVHWPVILSDPEQRNFEDVVSEFVEEGPGILNWLIDGVRDYLLHGLVVPDAVAESTKEYRDEMDPLGQFITDCLERTPADVEPENRCNVPAREMYDAYVSWAMANAVSPIFETRFGKTMKKRIPREDGRQRRYLDCRLVNVPVRPRNPERDRE